MHLLPFNFLYLDKGFLIFVCILENDDLKKSLTIHKVKCYSHGMCYNNV